MATLHLIKISKFLKRPSKFEACTVILFTCLANIDKHCQIHKMYTYHVTIVSMICKWEHNNLTLKIFPLLFEISNFSSKSD